METIKFKTSEIKSPLYFNRYMKMIEHYRGEIVEDGENHHIRPRCMGGTDDTDNIVRLPYRAHYVIHYILAKAIDEDKLWFAFNQMGRVCEGKSCLYAAARQYISVVISKSNSGRKKTMKELEQISKRTKNTVIVRDKDGNIFRVSANDPRYLSGELVFHRTGYKHKDSTKEKISNNGIKGGKVYHNKHTNKLIYLRENEIVPPDFVKGLPEETIDKLLGRLRKPRNLKLKTCPHCGVQGKGGNMTRYHYDNCKGRR